VPSTTVAVSWYHGRRSRTSAGNGISGPDVDDGVATGTIGSRQQRVELPSRAIAPTDGSLPAR